MLNHGIEQRTVLLLLNVSSCLVTFRDADIKLTLKHVFAGSIVDYFN